MVRHDDESVNGNMRKMQWDILPTSGGNPTRIIQTHPAINDFSEQGFSVLRTNGDEIGAIPRIIMARQTNGMPMMFVQFLLRPFTYDNRCLTN